MAPLQGSGGSNQLPLMVALLGANHGAQSQGGGPQSGLYQATAGCSYSGINGRASLGVFSRRKAAAPDIKARVVSLYQSQSAPGYLFQE